MPYSLQNIIKQLAKVFSENTYYKYLIIQKCDQFRAKLCSIINNPKKSNNFIKKIK